MSVEELGRQIDALRVATAAGVSRRMQVSAAIGPRSESGRVLPAVQPVIADVIVSETVGVEAGRDILRMVRRVDLRAEPTMVAETISSLINSAPGLLLSRHPASRHDRRGGRPGRIR